MKIKAFLLKDQKIERDSFIWNMAGSMLMAFQSVIMLMILTRTLGLKDAGIFTIAYANANLFLTVGKYGMRYFQISDMKGQFSFVNYQMSRVVSSLAMMVTALGNFRVTNQATFEALFGHVTRDPARLDHDIEQYVQMVFGWLTSGTAEVPEV